VQWGLDGKPVKPPHILGPDELYQSEEELNAKIPKKDWVAGFREGELRGPIQNQNVMVFGDLTTMDRYVWPSPVSTIGSAIAVSELSKRVKRMRQYRGERVFAVVKLTECIFPTNFGKRQRPYFEILDFVKPTDRGLVKIDTTALPSPTSSTPATPTTPAAPTTPTAPATSAQAIPPWESVSEPTLKEELRDEIQY
jgi:hypothetical protein